MHAIVATLSLLLIVLPAIGGPVVEEEKQETQKVLEALRSGKLAEVFAACATDRWILADRLRLRGEAAAAQALARAPSVGDEALRAYLEGAEVRAEDAGRLSDLDDRLEALRTGDHGKAAADPPGGPDDRVDVIATRSCFATGKAYEEIGRATLAAARYDRAAEIAKKLGWRQMEGRSRVFAACQALRAGRPEEAFTRLNEGLDLARGCDPRRFAYDLAVAGSMWARVGDDSRCREYMREALALAEKHGSAEERSGCLVMLGTTYLDQGEFRAAVEWIERGLQAAREAESPEVELVALIATGWCHMRLGRFADLLEVALEAVTLADRVGSAKGRAGAHALASQAYALTGDITTSREHLGEALEHWDRLGDADQQARAIARFVVAARVRDPGRDVSGEIERISALVEKTEDRWYRACIQENLGAALESAGDSAAAVEAIRAALVEFRHLGFQRGTLSSLTRLGRMLIAAGRIEAAGELLEEAAGLCPEVGAEFWLPRILYLTAVVRQSAGQSDESLALLRRAAERAAEVGQWEQEYDAWSMASATLLGLHRFEESMRAAHRALEVLPRLAEGLPDQHRAAVRARLDYPFTLGRVASIYLEDIEEFLFFAETQRTGALLDWLGGRAAVREVALPEELLVEEEEALRAEASALVRLRAAAEAGYRKSIRARRAELAAARKKVRSVLERIRTKEQRAARLVAVEAKGLEAIQSFLGPDAAYVVWEQVVNKILVAAVVTREEARLVKVGSYPDALAAAAKLSQCAVGSDPAPALAAFRKTAWEGLALGDEIRVVYLSSLPNLSFVPWSIVDDKRAIHCVPSMTTVIATAERAEKKGQRVLGVGDPVYGAPRAGLSLTLSRLPSSGEEVRQVSDVALLREKATEAGLAKALTTTERWRAVHFACHGLYNAEKPALSGLALTPGADRDGVLTVLEVLRLGIRADLVTLSACESARGKTYDLGVSFGLVYAFVVSGTRGVLASLWKVDDEATKTLMVRFYELWNPREGKGLPAAEALRKAQEFVRSHERWKHPFYWAAWVLWGVPD